MAMGGQADSASDCRSRSANRLPTTATPLFLAGPDGAWINGQALRANGGIN